MLVPLALLVAWTVACGPRARPKPTTGAIAGLVRDQDSGEALAKAEIRVRAASGERVTTSGPEGFYDVDHLPPGRYQLVASFAGQPLEVANIVVRAGEATAVDLWFTLGRPDPIRLDWGNLEEVRIQRYRPKQLGDQAGLVEGTVTATESRQRVAGAVVTVVGAQPETTQQTVTDDRGRFRFDPVPPGVYSVSAYYNISGRGQIEVLRNGITVGGGEAVVVPLWIELAR